MKKKTNKNNIVIVATVAIVAIAGVSVYAISNNDDGMMGKNNMMGKNSSQQVSSSSLVDKNSADYKMYSELTGDDYDRMFIANMIEHHKGAVKLPFFRTPSSNVFVDCGDAWRSHLAAS